MNECGCVWIEFYLPKKDSVPDLALRLQFGYSCYNGLLLEYKKTIISEYQFYTWSPYWIISLLIVLFSSFPVFLYSLFLPTSQLCDIQILIIFPPSLQTLPLISFSYLFAVINACKICKMIMFILSSLILNCYTVGLLLVFPVRVMLALGVRYMFMFGGLHLFLFFLRSVNKEERMWNLLNGLLVSMKIIVIFILCNMINYNSKSPTIKSSLHSWNKSLLA